MMANTEWTQRAGMGGDPDSVTVATYVSQAEDAAGRAEAAADRVDLGALDQAVTDAATSETNAATSETNAATSETNAATSETNAASSATAAAASASTATSQASSASTSATNAAASESAAATSETNAATSASNAATSATSAASAQTAAETARDQTLAAYDDFDDRYLGTKSSDPTVDNDGNALVAGALYFNSTDEIMKVYTGSAWVAAYASLSGTLLVANNLSDLASAASARTNLGLGTAAAAATTDFATSAQGTLADSAVQPNDSPSFGSVSVTGTITATAFSGDGSSLTGIDVGATGGGSDKIFWENDQNVTTDYTITNGQNAMSAGPITINSGVTVTIGTGETWTVV